MITISVPLMSFSLQLLGCHPECSSFSIFPLSLCLHRWSLPSCFIAYPTLLSSGFKISLLFLHLIRHHKEKSEMTKMFPSSLSEPRRRFKNMPKYAKSPGSNKIKFTKSGIHQAYKETGKQNSQWRDKLINQKQFTAEGISEKHRVGI